MSGHRPIGTLLLLAPAAAWLALTRPDAGHDAVPFLAAARLVERTGDWSAVYPTSLADGRPLAGEALAAASRELEPTLPAGALAPYVAPPMGLLLAEPFLALPARWWSAVCSLGSLLGGGLALGWADRHLGAPRGDRGLRMPIYLLLVLPTVIATVNLGQTGPLLALAALAFLPAKAGAVRLLGALALGVLVCLKGFPVVALAGLALLPGRRDAWLVAALVPAALWGVTLARWGAEPTVAYLGSLGAIGGTANVPFAFYGGPPLAAAVAVALGVLRLAGRPLRPWQEVADGPDAAGLGALALLAFTPVIWVHYAPVLALAVYAATTRHPVARSGLLDASFGVVCLAVLWGTLFVAGPTSALVMGLGAAVVVLAAVGVATREDASAPGGGAPR